MRYWWICWYIWITIKYGFSIVYEKGKKVLYLEVLKSIYGMLKSYILSYIKLRKYLETDGFKFNPYEPCVDNKVIEGEPIKLVFHVDYVK